MEDRTEKYRDIKKVFRIHSMYVVPTWCYSSDSEYDPWLYTWDNIDE